MRVTSVFFQFLVASMVLAGPASGSMLILNGGFSTGDFTDWTTTNSSGSNGSFFVTSSNATPLNAFPTDGAASDSYYAVTDAFDPGSHALTQAFTDPQGNVEVTLAFSYFINDQGGAGANGTSGPGFEVDLLPQSANALTATPLAVLFGPADMLAVNGAPNPYQTVNLDITADLVPGTTYQLRFLETDQTGIINVGVDSVSLNATANAGVPEPSEMMPLGLLAAGFFVYRRTKNDF